MSQETSSYGHILKASSIMGGAAAVNLLLGMVRVKFAAVLIGTAGVGLNASFAALQGVVGTVAGLGLQSSAVREIAAAVGTGDEKAVGRAVLSLRRLCWVTGLAGMVTMMLLSPLLSQLTFGHQNYAVDIAALGVVILFSNLSGGQLALIQGMRRIGDMARANVLGAVVGTVAAIGLYSTLRLRGIIPTLVAVSAFQLLLSWSFARRVPVPAVSLTLRQIVTEANGMVRLGLVMMLNGLMGSVVAYATVTLITRQEGTQAVGLYSAAFALSGMFASFVLGAMGADYYPRLTAAAGDHATMRRMVNEQTEIGLLLALPGLMATLVLAPWVLKLFYTAEFTGAINMLQWFTLGCLGRVISWPLGFVMLALGKGRWFLLTEMVCSTLHLVLIMVGIRMLGIEGVAVAFVVLYAGYVVGVHAVGQLLIEFAWSAAVVRIVLIGAPLLCGVIIINRNFQNTNAILTGLIVTLLTIVFSIRSLVSRLDPQHGFVRVVTRLSAATRITSA